MSRALALALVLPAAAGWALVTRLLPDADRSPLAVLGRIALAAIVGIGLSSLAAFVWLLTGQGLGRAYVVADAVLFAALALGLTAWPRRAPPVTSPPEAEPAPSAAPPSSSRALGFAALAVLGVALAIAIWQFVEAAAAMPHGQWDAWAVWNQRARFILRAGGEWRHAFARELSWSQIGYPLLVPLAVARLWAYAGETTVAPAAVSALFTLGAPAVIAAAAGAAAGPLAGAIAALLLLGTPGFMFWGVAQYADVPVAALLAAGLGALVAAEQAREQRRAGALALSGLLFGLAGWTKNEGLAGAALAVASYVFVASRARGLPAVLRDLRAIAWGAALPAAAWLAFHLAVVPAVLPDMPASTGTLAQKFLDAGRWTLVLITLAQEMPGSRIALPVLAILLAASLGLRPRSLLRSPPILAAALLYLVQVVFFIVTPWPLLWHLQSAGDRLLLHPWPAVLLGLFAATGARMTDRQTGAQPDSTYLPPQDRAEVSDSANSAAARTASRPAGFISTETQPE